MRFGWVLALGILAGWGCGSRPPSQGRLERTARGGRPLRVRLPNEQPGPLRAYRFVHGDPLWGKGGSALETPLMAPSTGRFGIITSPMIDGYRRIGPWKDD
ncbi:MAG: hypothetical protein JST54_19710 [Deltaproteobacteria bacterium]|nr:hypothetical protein [Deltaproteobacteria bacterium]